MCSQLIRPRNAFAFAFSFYFYNLFLLSNTLLLPCFFFCVRFVFRSEIFVRSCFNINKEIYCNIYTIYYICGQILSNHVLGSRFWNPLFYNFFNERYILLCYYNWVIRQHSSVPLALAVVLVFYEHKIK